MVVVLDATPEVLFPCSLYRFVSTDKCSTCLMGCPCRFQTRASGSSASYALEPFSCSR